MSVTLYSFAMAVFLSTLFVLFTHLFRRKQFFLRCFGIPIMLFLYGMCAFRILFPLEFPFTRIIGVQRELGDFIHLIRLDNTIPIGPGVSILQLAICIWMIGALVALAFFHAKYFHSLQKVKALEKTPELIFPISDAAKEVLSKIQEESSRNLPVTICLISGIDIPMGVGIFTKRILLPNRAYTEEELYYILKHEYTHFCNRDLVVMMLTRLFCCFFWWNPAAYLLQKDVSEILELKCDMACTAAFTKEQKLGYLNILTKLVEEAPEEKKGRLFSKTGVPFLQRNNNFTTKERFRLIAKPVKKGKLLGQILVASVFILFFVTSYAIVVQPVYQPPMEDIYTNESVYEVQIDSSDWLIVKHKDGSYSLRDGNENYFEIQYDAVEYYLANGLTIEEE